MTAELNLSDLAGSDAVAEAEEPWPVLARRGLDHLQAMVQREMLPMAANSSDPDKVRRYAEATRACLDKMAAAAAEADAAMRAMGPA